MRLRFCRVGRIQQFPGAAESAELREERRRLDEVGCRAGTHGLKRLLCRLVWLARRLGVVVCGVI
jgi:hypothetical protein